MAGAGFLLMVLAFWTAFALYKARGSIDRLLARRKLLLAWVLAIPLPYVAVECGWIVREVGRQPWIVYGLMRTQAAVSDVTARAVSGSMLMFCLFYVVLLASFFIFARKWLRHGPDLALMPPDKTKHPQSARAAIVH
jgi:cytochrome d ubiquinol oxidase subunit I